MTGKGAPKWARRAVIAAAAVSIIAGTAIAYFNVDERALGRTNPRRAAFYSPPLGNFVETYADGTALGFTVGMPKERALQLATKSGFTVEPISWGDNRAGGAELYTADELRAKAMTVDSLHMSTDREDVELLTLNFDRDRVRSITVGYINNGL